MGRQIIHHNNVARLQSRTKYFSHPREKDFPIDSSFNDPRSADAAQTQAGKHRLAQAVVLRHAIHDALTWYGSTIKSRHGQCRPGFINELQLPDFVRPDLRAVFDAQSFDAWGISLGGVK
jgi:hypothetical protein